MSPKPPPRLVAHRFARISPPMSEQSANRLVAHPYSGKAL